MISLIWSVEELAIAFFVGSFVFFVGCLVGHDGGGVGHFSFVGSSVFFIEGHVFFVGLGVGQSLLDLVGSFVSFFHILSTDLSDGALVGFGVGFFVGFGVGQSSESESLSDPLPEPESIFSALLFAPNHHAVGGRVDSSVFFVGSGVGQSCLDLVGSFVSFFHTDLSEGALVGFGVGFFVG